MIKNLNAYNIVKRNIKSVTLVVAAEATHISICIRYINHTVKYAVIDSVLIGINPI